MAQLISITKAKQHFLELARRNAELGESFVVLKDSEPVSVLMPIDEYEALMETLDIIEAEPNILIKLKKAEREIAKGKYVKWKPLDVKKKHSARKKRVG